MFQGLRTVIYHVSDLDRAKTWYASVLGVEPYFDQPFYVGFNVGGFELGLDPDTSGFEGGSGGVAAYWGVIDCEAAFNRLLELGASAHSPVQDVGGGIRAAAGHRSFRQCARRDRESSFLARSDEVIHEQEEQWQSVIGS